MRGVGRERERETEKENEKKKGCFIGSLDSCFGYYVVVFCLDSCSFLCPFGCLFLVFTAGVCGGGGNDR